MKFLIAFAAVAAVAVAVPVQRELITPVLAGPAAVVDDAGQPIVISPVIVESPVSVGPAIVDFPVPDCGDVTAVEPSPVVVPSPVVIGDIPAGANPLVQIIINVNPESAVPTPVIDEEYVPSPGPVIEPVQVVEPVIVEPVQVVEPVVVEPIQVVEPVIVEPIIVDTPIVPSPVVVLPDILN